MTESASEALTSPAAPGPPEVKRRSWTKTARGLTETYGILWVTLLGLVAASLISDQFLTWANIQNVLSQNAPLGLVALGMTFVMIGGGFDLSSGAIVGASTVVAAELANHQSLGVAIAGTIIGGAIAGGINGTLVTRLRINPFVATLATSSIFTGAALLYTKSLTVVVTNPNFGVIGNGTIFGVRTSIVMLVALFVIFAFILSKSIYGRALYAAGGNEQAARLSGMRVDLLRASTYVLVGAGAGAAGLIYASLLNTGDPSNGAAITLDAITVVILGGTSLFGGAGAVWRTAAGLVLLATITNVFDLLAIESAWQQVTKGALLITAVGLDLLTRRNAS